MGLVSGELVFCAWRGSSLPGYNLGGLRLLWHMELRDLRVRVMVGPGT